MSDLGQRGAKKSTGGLPVGRKARSLKDGIYTGQEGHSWLQTENQKFGQSQCPWGRRDAGEYWLNRSKERG